MRKPIIAGNWKMNKTLAEAVDFAKAVKNANALAPCIFPLSREKLKTPCPKRCFQKTVFVVASVKKPVP